jgi:hypothetical protein
LFCIIRVDRYISSTVADALAVKSGTGTLMRSVFSENLDNQTRPQ